MVVSLFDFTLPMRRILSCLIVALVSLLVMLVLKRVGFLEMLSKDIAGLWSLDGIKDPTAMPVASVLIDFFAGAVAAGMAWVCIDMRSWLKQGAVFAIGVLLTITAPAVWLQGGIIIDAAPILVGLFVGLIGGQICAGLTWEESQKAHFEDRLQNRCEAWVCERLSEAGALTTGKDFPSVVIGLRAVGHKVLPEGLHQRLQRALKMAGAIVDDTQVQNLVGVVPAVVSQSDVARVIYDGIEMLRQEIFDRKEKSDDESSGDDEPEQFRVVVRVGEMSVREVNRLDGRSDIAVGGAGLTDVLAWLYDHVDEASGDAWTVIYDEAFTEVDKQITAVRVEAGLVAGEAAYTLKSRPDDVPEPEPERQTQPAAATVEIEDLPVVVPRVVRAKVAPKPISIEEKIVAEAPKRIKLTVKPSATAESDASANT